MNAVMLLHRDALQGLISEFVQAQVQFLQTLFSRRRKREAHSAPIGLARDLLDESLLHQILHSTTRPAFIESYPMTQLYQGHRTTTPQFSENGTLGDRCSSTVGDTTTLQMGMQAGHFSQQRPS